MAFTSVENKSSGLMKEGEYEAFCSDAKITTTENRTDTIAFDFVIRTDVEQAYQRKHVFKNFYQDDNGEWPGEKIGKFASSMGIPNGTEFELNDLIGRNLILVIKHFTGSDGVERECIYYTKKTEHESNISNFVDLSPEESEDCPF